MPKLSAASLLPIALAFAGSAVAGPATAAAPALIVTLKPAAPAADRNVPYVEVTLSVQAMHAGAGEPLLRMARVSSNVQSIAETVQDLQVSDAKGPVALTIKDDPDGGQVSWRHWTASRPVEGDVQVRYRAPITNALNPRGAAPPLELRTEDGGFSGAGGVFLILPENATAYHLSVRWDLSAAGPGAIGVSNLGVGDVGQDTPAPAEALSSIYFMGGAIHRYPAVAPRNGFFSAWQGSPPFDAVALMQWTQALYQKYMGYFQADPTPYGVFLRRNLINAGGGVEMGGSFVGTFDKDTDIADFKSTLAHEMVHTFVGSLDDSDDLSGSWYSEGLAVFYERVLPLRAGLIGADAFLKDLNTTAGRYYTDALNDAPNSEIPKRFWADTRIRVLPYDRGALYFAKVDSEVRKASGGKRSLDDLVLAMLARRRAGARLHQSDWVDLVTKELGDRGRTEFEAMLAGQLVLPDPDAFGPCFTRTTAPLRRFELGFDTKVLIEPRRIVRGLVPGSAAERAGLRNGDEIVKPAPQDRIQADQQAMMTLQVRRNGQISTISYLPRGETVQAYQWRRAPAQPDSACRP